MSADAGRRSGTRPRRPSRRRRSCSSRRDAALDPLLVPPLPREPAARRVQLRRDPDPAGVPGADPDEAATPKKPRAAPTRGGADGRQAGAGRAGRAVGRRAAGGGRRGGRVGHDARRHPRPARSRSRSSATPRRRRHDPRHPAQRGAPAGHRPAGRDPRRRPIRRRSPRRDLVVVAVPSTHVRETLARVAPHLPATADVLSVVKGLERGHPPADERGHRRGRRHRPAARRRAVGPEPRR